MPLRFVSKNYNGMVIRSYVSDFYRILAYDRQTDRQTDRHIATA